MHFLLIICELPPEELEPPDEIQVPVDASHVYLAEHSHDLYNPLQVSPTPSKIWVKISWVQVYLYELSQYVPPLEPELPEDDEEPLGLLPDDDE